MIGIKQSHVSENHIIITDVHNKLWIMGSNANRYAGVGKKNSYIYNPLYTGIVLNKNDSVKKVSSNDDECVILTTSGKLYKSNRFYKNNNNKKKSKTTNPDSNDTIYYGANDADDADDADDNCDDCDCDCDASDASDASDAVDVSYDTEDVNLNNSTNLDDFNEINKFNPLLLINNCDDDDNLIEIKCNQFDFDDFFESNDFDFKIPLGFTLINTNVKRFLLIESVLFFETNYKLYMLLAQNKSTVIDTWIKKTNLSTILKIAEAKNNIYYYELIFPFDIEKVYFMQNYIYFTANNYNHILSVTALKDHASDDDVVDIYPVWLYFKCDFQLNSGNMLYDADDASLIIKNDCKLYRYYHKSHSLVVVANSEIPPIFIDTDSTICKHIIMLKSNTFLYDGSDFLSVRYNKKEIDFLNNIVDYYNYDDSEALIILVDVDNDWIMKHADTILYVNVHNFKYYKLDNYGLTYFTENTLYLCSFEKYAQLNYNTQEISSVQINAYTKYYIYLFNNVPANIDNIQTSTAYILIRSNGKHYYTIKDADFMFSNGIQNTAFSEIILESPNSTCDVVTNYIKRPIIDGNYHNDYDNLSDEPQEITIYVDKDSMNLNKMLSIVELLPTKIKYNVSFTHNGKKITYGNGPKRELMDSAITEFANKYLITHNTCTEFNVNELIKLSDNQLFYIGKMLHSIIAHSETHLSIRLPLDLLCELKTAELSVAELEYFANLEDPIYFKNVYRYKNKPNEFKELDTDFVCYRDCLKYICKYDYNSANKSKIHNICDNICKGIRNFKKIINLSIMNIVTLDYYFSDKVSMDRDLLIKNIYITSDSLNESEITEYKSKITNIVKNLDKDKLIILLKNWSGTTIIQNTTYTINIKKQSNTNDIDTNTNDIDKRQSSDTSSNSSNNTSNDSHSTFSRNHRSYHRHRDIDHDIFFSTCNYEMTICDNIFTNNDAYKILMEYITTPDKNMVDESDSDDDSDTDSSNSY